MLFWITLHGKYPGKNPNRFQKCMGVVWHLPLGSNIHFWFLSTSFHTMAVTKTDVPQATITGSNFSPTKTDKKRNVFVKTSIQILFAAEWDFWKTNISTENWNNFFFFVERSWNPKVFYLEVNSQHSFFKVFSLKKKKSCNLHHFVSSTE